MRALVVLAKPLASLTSDVYDAFLRGSHHGRLEHPGIINLFDGDRSRRASFFMELKRGGPAGDFERMIAGDGTNLSLVAPVGCPLAGL